jgi:hypothetical protein
MKKYLPYIIICFCLLLLSAILLLSYSPENHETEKSIEAVAPQRLTEIGPYGRNICLTEQIGECTLSVRAQRLYSKKTKLFGFNCALKKKLVAKGLNIIVYKNKDKVFDVYKDKINLPMNMKTIEIHNPTVLYPKSMESISRINIEKKKLRATIFYKDRTEVLDFAKL